MDLPGRKTFTYDVPAVGLNGERVPLTASEVAPAGTCRHCGKAIRWGVCYGRWGARKRDDPHPWYCDAAGGPGWRHEPAGPVTECTCGALAALEREAAAR